MDGIGICVFWCACIMYTLKGQICCDLFRWLIQFLMGKWVGNPITSREDREKCERYRFFVCSCTKTHPNQFTLILDDETHFAVSFFCRSSFRKCAVYWTNAIVIPYKGGVFFVQIKIKSSTKLDSHFWLRKNAHHKVLMTFENCVYCLWAIVWRTFIANQKSCRNAQKNSPYPLTHI